MLAYHETNPFYIENMPQEYRNRTNCESEVAHQKHSQIIEGGFTLIFFTKNYIDHKMNISGSKRI